MKLRVIAAALAIVCPALISSAGSAGSAAQSTDTVECDSLERFSKLDPTVELDDTLVDEAQQLTAELVGHDEVTAIAEVDALPPDEARAAGIEPKTVMPQQLGVHGVRAVVFDSDGNPTVVVTPDVPRPALAYAMLVSCVRDQDLAAVDEGIAAISLIDDQFVSAGYSPFTDRIQVVTNLDPKAIAAALPYAMPGRQMSVDNAKASRADRRWDFAQHYAGAQINDGSSSGYDCSSGFYVWSAAYGPFMLSAGHCSWGVPQVFNNGNNSQYFGTVAARSFPNPDLLIMNGSTYIGRTYSGPDQTTWARVEGASNPTYSISYCNNGASSLETCSNLSNSVSTYCDASGCTTDLAYHERACAWGPIAAGGDSGGPVTYHKANGRQQAKGIVIAEGSGGTPCAYRMWYHKWTTISNIWGLSIVNG